MANLYVSSFVLCILLVHTPSTLSDDTRRQGLYGVLCEGSSLGKGDSVTAEYCASCLTGNCILNICNLFCDSKSMISNCLLCTVCRVLMGGGGGGSCDGQSCGGKKIVKDSKVYSPEECSYKCHPGSIKYTAEECKRCRKNGLVVPDVNEIEKSFVNLEDRQQRKAVLLQFCKSFCVDVNAGKYYCKMCSSLSTTNNK